MFQFWAIKSRSMHNSIRTSVAFDQREMTGVVFRSGKVVFDWSLGRQCLILEEDVQLHKVKALTSSTRRRMPPSVLKYPGAIWT